MRNKFITIFVILWLVVFHYESTRHFYLERWLQRPLPKVPLLFPPAGWIMFFQVDGQFGHAQVYGVKDKVPQPIDPHEIIVTRFVGFDNVHRNVLSTVLSPRVAPAFCRHLGRKFPYFDDFIVSVVRYPSVTTNRFERQEAAAYSCNGILK